MHDYVYGAGLALAEIAGHLQDAAEKPEGVQKHPQDLRKDLQRREAGN